MDRVHKSKLSLYKKAMDVSVRGPAPREALGSTGRGAAADGAPGARGLQGGSGLPAQG